MSEFKKNLEEKVGEILEQADLAKEVIEEKLADTKDKTGAAYDNVLHSLEEKKDEFKLQAELGKENAAGLFADLKDKAEPTLDNALKNAKIKVGDLGEEFKNSEYGQKILGEDGKLDSEDVKRVANEAVDKIKGIFKKEE